MRDIIQGFLSCRITISLWRWLLLIKFAFLWTLQSCFCMHLFNSDLHEQHIRITKLCKTTVGNSYTYMHMGEKKNSDPLSFKWLWRKFLNKSTFSLSDDYRIRNYLLQCKSQIISIAGGGPSPFLCLSYNIQNTDLKTVLLKEGLLSPNCRIILLTDDRKHKSVLVNYGNVEMCLS